jgi:hypothetical protein
VCTPKAKLLNTYGQGLVTIVKHCPVNALQELSRNTGEQERQSSQRVNRALNIGKDFHTGEATFLRAGFGSDSEFNNGCENFRPTRW